MLRVNRRLLLVTLPVSVGLGLAGVLGVPWLFLESPPRDLSANLVASDETLLTMLLEPPTSGMIRNMTVTGQSARFTAGTEDSYLVVSLEKIQAAGLVAPEWAAPPGDNVPFAARYVDLQADRPALVQAFMEPGKVTVWQERGTLFHLAVPGRSSFVVSKSLEGTNVFATLGTNGDAVITNAAMQCSQYDYDRTHLLNFEPYSLVATEVRFSLLGTSTGTEPFEWSKANDCPWLVSDLEPLTPVWAEFYGPSVFNWSGPVTSVTFQGYGGRVSIGETESTIQATQAVQIILESGHLSVDAGALTIQGVAKAVKVTTSPDPYCGPVEQATARSILPTRWSASGSLREVCLFVAGFVVGWVPQMMRLVLSRSSHR